VIPADGAGSIKQLLNDLLGGSELGDEWQMTGSGSAFFKRCANEQEARRAIQGLDGWTAVTSSIEPWE